MQFKSGGACTRITRSFEFQIGSKEEKLPYTDPSFPYIASRAELDFYCEPFTFVPWHWHNAIELFYMESGVLKYYTPNKTLLFPSGSARMFNGNVLHMTQIQTRREKMSSCCIFLILNYFPEITAVWLIKSILPLLLPPRRLNWLHCSQTTRSRLQL